MLILFLSLIAYSAAFALGLWIGWKLRDIKDWVRLTTEYATRKFEPKQPQAPKPTATVIDPGDIVQRAKWERDQMTNAINSPEINE